MHRRTKLAITALLFVILGWLYIHTDRLPGSARKLEFKLAMMTREAVAESGNADWARVDLRGRGATVRGVAPSEAARAEVLSAVKSARGIGAARDETDLMRRVSPYVFTATLEGSALTLSGYAPDRSTRDALAARAARVFAGEVDAEGVEVAGGDPEGADWLGAVDFGVSQLVRLRAGTLEIVDTSMRITGEAANIEVRSDVMRQLYQAPYPFTGTGDVLVPGGVSAMEELEAAVEAAAELVDDTDNRRDASPGAGRSVAVAAAVRPIEPDVAACRSDLAALLDGEPIRFQFSEAEVSEASAVLLDAVADVARACEAFELVIEGHTDLSGDPAFNVYLSQLRARAVLDALVSRGVNPAQLTAAGLGSSEPVADNATAAGRARNRRIEIEVIDPRESRP